MKKNLILILFLFSLLICQSGSWASSGPIQPVSVNPQILPQPIDFNLCNKTFKIETQKLFYLTLASVNANKFKIEEIKSKSGYILFSVAKNQYLATVVKIDAKNSMLKITPCNNVYYFPSGIVQNVFRYIEINSNTPIQKLAVI